jgi:hypothetical protein
LHGSTGYLCQPGDADAIAGRWIELLKDAELRDQMGRKGRAHVVDNSSLDAMTTGYTELIESLYRDKKAAGQHGRQRSSGSIFEWAGSVLQSRSERPTF